MTREELRVALPSGLTLTCAGQGDRSGPALVLVPGPTDSWSSYVPVLDVLPPSIRTIALAPRGHGDSDKPPAGYAVEDFAADVVGVLDALGVDRAVVAGHSGSCLTARRVALDRPDRVAGLVLEASPFTLRGDPGLTAFVDEVVDRLADPIDPEFARSFVLGTSSDDVAPALLDGLVADVLKVPAHVWQEMFEGLLAYDDTTELARISAPVLLVWGDADEVVGREHQDQLAAALPSARLIVYPGVGHTPRWDDPARFTADVAAFVAATSAT